ncbi:MAG: glycosyltransferase family 2 protein [Lachnospiraceae bacterium]|nr:glycosyltransferase family 2 protein [Lachnospiraceae bacterium]
MQSDILLIIPAYNEEANIIRVVETLKNEYPQYDYIVVNDGSSDRTGEICRERGYRLVDYPVNLGLAGAFQGGMKYAFLKGYKYAMQYDGDGQHDPQFVLPMLETAEREQCDVVIGSRFVTEEKPWTARMFGSRVIGFCIKLTTGKRINDPTSGMRLFNRKMIHILANQVNYGPEPDTIAFLVRCGADVRETQVSMKERIAGESYLKFLPSIKYMVRMCMSILVVQWFRKKV